MSNYAQMLGAIKQAAVEAVDASGPVTLVFGKVKSVDPFLVDVEQKLTLTETFITVGQYVKEYSLDLTIDGEMWHGFRKDDELIMARMQGGQKYVIMDFVKRAEEDTRPARVMQGEVVSIDGLEIKVCDYLTLTADQLILCRGVIDYHTFLSFDNPAIKQKISLYDRAEKEPLPQDVHTGKEPHPPRPDDIPPPIVEKTTDVVFLKKQFVNAENFKDESGARPGMIELPAFHEVTVYNHLHVGDKVLLVNERILQKWFVVAHIDELEPDRDPLGTRLH